MSENKKFSSQWKAYCWLVLASLLFSSTVVVAQASTLTIRVNGAEFQSAPTLWAWVSGGTAISEAEGYSWNTQPAMLLDPTTGFYSWTMDSQYQVELDSGLNLNFIINRADEFSRNSSGCYNDNHWYDSYAECLNEPFAPYIGPYLTLLNPDFASSDNTPTVLDPATSMVINYELRDVSGDFVAQAYYRPANANDWIVQDEDPVGPVDPELGKVRHITLQNLQPNTQYFYKVTGEDGQFSAQYYFTTAKTNMDYSHFLVVGDMQDEQMAQRWHDVAQSIVADHMDEFDYIITVGDMVKDDMPQNGDRFHWWKVFFDKGQDLFAYKPMLPAIGNHETPANPALSGKNPDKQWEKEYWSNAEDTRTFRKYFYLNPDMSQPDYYSFRYGNACLISVNSEIPVFYGRHPERNADDSERRQALWLEAQVNEAQQCAWSFAYWHVPPINPAGGKDEVPFLRPYVDYFNGKLDWSITGHVHEYQRVKPVEATHWSLDFNKTGYGRGDNQGVGYLIAPPAGQWPRNNASDQMDQLAFYPHNENGVGYEIGFSIIRVDGDQFSLKTYGLGGVGNRVQPAGYRVNDDRSKQLLDSVDYSKANAPYTKVFSFVDFRGSSNNWNRTPMTLVADNTWQFDVTVSNTDGWPRFKFYADYRWYGDQEPDGVTNSYEQPDIAFTQGPGVYTITLTDNSRLYRVDKQ
ncbi:metallophosphoesterase family protein [Reinekea sp.]|uniref:metallophosphoesterase family protein n=1 Tax=Reinekea sp. TaxID=1970455 RepID=UPI002A80B434|nr:metallophosphoesterase family protein [Reinekea sp.]